MSDNLLKLVVIFLLVFLNFPFTYSRNIDFVNENIQKESDCSENTLKESKVVYLTPNFVNGKNVLTQDMISKANTYYIIQCSYDLNKAEIMIPDGCVLDFQGGCINNGCIYLSNHNYLKGFNTVFDNIYVKYNKNIQNVSIEGIEFIGRINKKAGSKKELTVCVSYSGESSINRFTMERCVVRGYNRGVSLKASNANISNNLFYDNGWKETIAGIHDAEVDIMFYAAVHNTQNNIIIRNNKCLSNYVHRNIDVGELYAENNVIIDGNICVSHSDLNTEDPVTLRKSQCILVGYAEYSDIVKNCIISNNICKHASWSGIYVRGWNTGERLYSSKYIANIHDNYLENIVRKETSYLGAIAVTTREGSIISNNIIVKCTMGINVGFIRQDRHTAILGNQILDSETAILVDSFGYEVNIQHNTIKRAKLGIIINEVSESKDDSNIKHASILNNIIEVKKGEAESESFAIRLYTYYCNNVNVSNNSIIGHNNEIGVQVVEAQNMPKPLGFRVVNNVLNNLRVGVFIGATNHLRNGDRYVDFNRFYKCKTGISVSVNHSKQLFIVEGNTFEECDAKFNDQSWSNCLYEGKKKTDGAWIIYDDRDSKDYSHSVYGYITNAPVCFLKKQFFKGDEVVSSKGYFDRAVCQDSAPDGESDSYSKWRVENGRMKTSMIEFCALAGQVVYDSTLKVIKIHNNTGWIVFPEQ